MEKNNKLDINMIAMIDYYYGDKIKELTNKELEALYTFIVKNVIANQGSYKITTQKMYKEFKGSYRTIVNYIDFLQLLSMLIKSGLVEVKKDKNINIYTINRNIEPPSGDSFIKRKYDYDKLEKQLLGLDNLKKEN